jgi:hypothetical protein
LKLVNNGGHSALFQSHREVTIMKTLLLALFATLTASQGFAMDSLSELHWKKRIVVVFGQADDPMLKRQVELLEKRQAELAERDMVVIRVADGEARAVYGQAPVLNATALREEAGVDQGFRVILVGKDGGVKLRSSEVVSDLELFELIDRMPMRRAEKG